MQKFKRGPSPDSNKLTNKKVKKVVQSNTLLSYFESSKKVEVKKPTLPQQTSILSFFKKETTNEDKKENLESYSLVCSQNSDEKFKIKTEYDIKHELDIEKEFKLIQNSNIFDDQNPSIIKNENKYTEIYESESINETSSAKTTRKCPFYKRIEGTRIVVDAFSYGDIENCDAYFLSHYHYDHFVGLNRHFKNNLYCSKITANLVLSQIKVNEKFIRVLELNKFANVYDSEDSIQVCPIDANHCPGSVMFLFRFKKTGKYVLHTGDFRASDDLVNNSFFKSVKIDTIHLDTTYCDSFYKFLPQSRIVSLGVELVINELQKQPEALIVCGSYTIGKERVFLAIAEKLDIKVYVTKEKKKILDCLENSCLNKIVTLNPNETNLHVIPMGKLNIRDLQTHLDSHPTYNYLIAVKPTGWTHKEPNGSNDGFTIEKKSKNIIIFGLEYSEHSSFDELKNCISVLRPRKIIPHVNVGKKESREKMQSYFDAWLSISKQA